MRFPRIRRVISAGALLLLIAIIADQSLCYSCPTEFPDETTFSSLDEADSGISCVLCLSRLTRAVRREPLKLQASFAALTLSEPPVERLLTDPVYHPPRR